MFRPLRDYLELAMLCTVIVVMWIVIIYLVKSLVMGAV